LVQLGEGDSPAQSLSLAAGLALAEAVDAALSGQALMLKWPNDLMLLGNKLAGILLERSRDRVVVGFGVNLASSPDLQDRKGASLGGEVTPQAFAPLLAASFARLLGLWRSSDPALIAQAWLARAHPIGTPLSVHASADETISGHFDGLEPDGALRLRREDGSLEVIRAGDVEL
jgi:BirA family transcriptional regulator, biotin operon repressor / biotin---[acetyl-CoA-carboxylase] ligase